MARGGSRGGRGFGGGRGFRDGRFGRFRNRFFVGGGFPTFGFGWNQWYWYYLQQLAALQYLQQQALYAPAGSDLSQLNAAIMQLTAELNQLQAQLGAMQQQQPQVVVQQPQPQVVVQSPQPQPIYVQGPVPTPFPQAVAQPLAGPPAYYGPVATMGYAG